MIKSIFRYFLAWAVWLFSKDIKKYADGFVVAKYEARIILLEKKLESYNGQEKSLATLVEENQKLRYNLRAKEQTLRDTHIMYRRASRGRIETIKQLKTRSKNLQLDVNWLEQYRRAYLIMKWEQRETRRAM